MLAIPNFSEGRDPRRIAAIARALTASRGVRLLDIHSDPDHNRTVYTLAGADGLGAEPGRRADGGRGARRSSCSTSPAHEGSHPHVGLLDVAPIVYMDDAERGGACAQALTLGDRLGHELGIPVFLYGAAHRVAGHARGDQPRRPAGLQAPHRQRRADAGLRAPAAASARRGGARERPAAADRLQRRTRSAGDARDRAGRSRP